MKQFFGFLVLLLVCSFSVAQSNSVAFPLEFRVPYGYFGADVNAIVNQIDLYVDADSTGWYEFVPVNSWTLQVVKPYLLSFEGDTTWLRIDAVTPGVVMQFDDYIMAYVRSTYMYSQLPYFLDVHQSCWIYEY